MLSLSIVGLLGLTLTVAPARAHGVRRSEATSADLGALVAYHTYLADLTATGQRSAGRAALVVEGVAHTCPDALSDLKKLSGTQLKRSALTNFGNEVDADLALAYISTSRSALMTFAATLDGLNWSTLAQFATTMNLIDSERALLGTVPSNLCADAIALDSAPLSEPTTTRRFLNRYRGAFQALQSALGAFGTLLAEFETTAEQKLVVQINALVSRFSARSTAIEQANAGSVLSELGIKS